MNSEVFSLCIVYDEMLEKDRELLNYCITVQKKELENYCITVQKQELEKTRKDK